MSIESIIEENTRALNAVYIAIQALEKALIGRTAQQTPVEATPPKSAPAAETKAEAPAATSAPAPTADATPPAVTRDSAKELAKRLMAKNKDGLREVLGKVGAANFALVADDKLAEFSALCEEALK